MRPLEGPRGIAFTESFCTMKRNPMKRMIDPILTVMRSSVRGRLSLFGCVGLILLLQVVPGSAQQASSVKGAAPPIEDAAELQRHLDSFMELAREKAGFSGAVLVARGGDPVYEGAFGYSHLDAKRPNTLLLARSASPIPSRVAKLSPISNPTLKFGPVSTSPNK